MPSMYDDVTVVSRMSEIQFLRSQLMARYFGCQWAQQPLKGIERNLAAIHAATGDSPLYENGESAVVVLFDDDVKGVTFRVYEDGWVNICMTDDYGSIVIESTVSPKREFDVQTYRLKSPVLAPCAEELEAIWRLFLEEGEEFDERTRTILNNMNRFSK